MGIQALQSRFDPLAGDAFQLGVDHHHVVVAVEHLGEAPGPLPLSAAQPVHGLALILHSGHRLAEPVAVLLDGQSDQLQLLFGSQGCPSVGLSQQLSVVHGDPPVFCRLQRIRQALQHPGGLGLLAGLVSGDPELRANRGQRLIAFQLPQPTQQRRQVPVKLPPGHIGLQDLLDQI